MSLNDFAQHLPIATYTTTASALTFWGLHVSDFAVMVASLAAVCSAAIQVLSYLDRRRTRRRGVTETTDGEAD